MVQKCLPVCTPDVPEVCHEHSLTQGSHHGLCLRACRFRIAAMDMRGHGETVTDDDADLSAATLVQARRPACMQMLPVAFLMQLTAYHKNNNIYIPLHLAKPIMHSIRACECISRLYTVRQPKAATIYLVCGRAQDAAAVWAALYGEEQAPTVLVGHSAGGAVAVRLAADPQVAWPAEARQELILNVQPTYGFAFWEAAFHNCRRAPSPCWVPGAWHSPMLQSPAAVNPSLSVACP